MTQPAAFPDYPPRFARALAKLLRTEGGFVNDPADRGGATNYGISLRFALAEARLDPAARVLYDLDMDGDIDVDDIRALTREQAGAIYYRSFWQRLRCADLPAPIGEMVFDQAVNGGAVAAVKLLQRAINDCLRTSAGIVAGASRPDLLVADGAVGPRTMAALNWCLARPSIGMVAVVTAYRVAAANRYRQIALENPSQAKFLKGWLRRAADLGRGL